MASLDVHIPMNESSLLSFFGTMLHLVSQLRSSRRDYEIFNEEKNLIEKRTKQ